MRSFKFKDIFFITSYLSFMTVGKGDIISIAFLYSCNVIRCKANAHHFNFTDYKIRYVLSHTIMDDMELQNILVRNRRK